MTRIKIHDGIFHSDTILSSYERIIIALPDKTNDKSNIETNKSVVIMSSERVAVATPFFRLILFFLLIELLDGMDLLFELHSSILKPDFDLSFGKAKLMGHFDPSSSREVVICVKLLLQLQGLISGVSLFDSSPEDIVVIKKICTRIWTA